MKYPKLTSANLLKFLRELTIIFISIVLAFLFDDYREHRNQIEDYRETLLNFQEEVLGTINQKSHIDSLRVASDSYNQGREFERLLNILWLDSLIDVRRAKLIDFEFMLRSNYLTADLYGGYGISPLSQEIQVKYGDQIINKELLESLRNYDEEMINVQRLQQTMLESHRLLNQLIEKTNPYYKFNQKDSLIFYSNEFLWRLKDIVYLRKQEYSYKKLLYQRRFKRTLIEINKELNEHKIKVPDQICSTIDNYVKRFECENNRPIEDSDSLRTIKELVKFKREKFRTERAVHNTVF